MRFLCTCSLCMPPRAHLLQKQYTEPINVCHTQHTDWKIPEMQCAALSKHSICNAQRHSLKVHAPSVNSSCAFHLLTFPRSRARLATSPSRTGPQPSAGGIGRDEWKCWISRPDVQMRQVTDHLTPASSLHKGLMRTERRAAPKHHQVDTPLHTNRHRHACPRLS